jgi:hypothetical protein
MDLPIKLVLPLLGLCVASPQASAALITLQGESLIYSYESDALTNMGNLEAIGNQLLFHPSVSVHIDSQTTDYLPISVDAYSDPYSAVINIQAKPGYRIDNHQITNQGFTYNEVGASEPYTFSSQSSTLLPLLTITGSLSLGATGTYAYDAPGGIRDEPIYQYRTITEIVDYKPEFDAFGNIIGQTPIYQTHQEEVIVGYNSIETFYPVYKINGIGLSLNNITVDFQVSKVPLPPAAWLFLSGLMMTGLSRKRIKVTA